MTNKQLIAKIEQSPIVSLRNHLVARGLSFGAKQKERRGSTGARSIAEGQFVSYQQEAEALFRMGRRYMHGDGVPENSAEAARFYRMAADRGHVEAQWVLGVMYEDGEEIPQDFAQAKYWYRKAAEQGHLWALWTLCGCRSTESDRVAIDPVEALSWRGKLENLAEKGNVEAQYILAGCYDKVDEAAVQIMWYRKAADQGHMLAQSALGGKYALGYGCVAQDYIESLRWYHKAAEQGDASALIHVAAVYELGLGVPKDMDEAVNWYRKGVALGHPGSQFALGCLYAEGEGVPQDLAHAKKLLHMAAENPGDLWGRNKFYLGCMYAEGDGIPQDLVQARLWFSLAYEADPDDPLTSKYLGKVENIMTAEQIAEAQWMAREWTESHKHKRDSQFGLSC